MAERDDMLTAQVMLLKSIAVIVGSELDCERMRSALHAVLEHLDANVMAGYWQALSADAAWLLGLARKGGQ